MFRISALIVALVLPNAAFGQTEPGPPGPYVFDVRGAMIGLPNAGEFYPALPESSNIPGRGFGGDIGAHVLFKRLGPSRVGFGVNGIYLRGTVGPPGVTALVSALAPQLSFNFGTADGWSYLSAGFGPGRLSTEVTLPDPVEPTMDDGDEEAEEEEAEDMENVDADLPDPPTTKRVSVGVINLGGGARWFVKSHVAVGFDLRIYRFSASRAEGTPASMRVALSVGISLR